MRALVERLFPGMGVRPLWMSVLAVLCLVFYFHEGRPSQCPAWFLNLSLAFTGVEARIFHHHLWAHCSAVVILMAVPLLACFVLEGWRPSELGLSARGAKREFILVIGLWLAFLPVVWWFSGTDAFLQRYPRLPEARGNLQLLLAYDGCYLIKWIAWEFFFRGYMLLGFKRDFGNRAVLISTIPFVLMHFGKPEAEVYGALPAGLILCAIALRARSIWPGVLLHWLVASSMDFFAAF
ncbi:MAG: CPBP family glutamic-type intramembrane protease [Planctomycetota bacterium]|jgi:membrane protease YdiL (CAAX protease family)